MPRPFCSPGRAAGSIFSAGCRSISPCATRARRFIWSHGVCHAYFLEAVAELAREGAFLGAWSLLAEMPEARPYREATEYVGRQMFNNPSIVNGSILSAVEGRFGDYHATYRTAGSSLFINPLMGLYWAFRLGPVVARSLYKDHVRDTDNRAQVELAIAQYRALTQQQKREWLHLPM